MKPRPSSACWSVWGATSPIDGVGGCVNKLLIGSLAALLAACASTHQLHPEASAVDPNSLHTQESLKGIVLDAAAWPQAQWWTAYGDAQLNGLIDEALAGNPGL